VHRDLRAIIILRGQPVTRCYVPCFMLKRSLPVLLSTICATLASAQSFPLWERILKHYGGKTDDTPVPSMLEWMTHVYPDEPEKWGGMHMDMESGG
jgi:hypothetical protein